MALRRTKDAVTQQEVKTPEQARLLEEDTDYLLNPVFKPLDAPGDSVTLFWDTDGIHKEVVYNAEGKARKRPVLGG